MRNTITPRGHTGSVRLLFYIVTSLFGISFDLYNYFTQSAASPRLCVLVLLTSGVEFDVRANFFKAYIQNSFLLCVYMVYVKCLYIY